MIVIKILMTIFIVCVISAYIYSTKWLRDRDIQYTPIEDTLTVLGYTLAIVFVWIV